MIKDKLDYYIVGGWVRDKIMGNEPNDKDYVVVGSSQEEMKALGFEQVGKSFPVFIHPETGDEWALARQERKSSEGYYGFETETNDVSLRQDLKRRDFTCNAIAYDPEFDEYIDPFEGQIDIMNNTLRHVSEAFKEDPLRVMRMFRFATRLGFDIDEDTIELALEVRPELDNLPNERYGQEIKKACKESNNIKRYFKLMKRLEVDEQILPELHQLSLVPAGYNDNHNEGNAFDHTLMVLEECEKIDKNNLKLYLMALSHDLGKYITHFENDGNHGGHDKKGIDRAESLADFLRLSNDLKYVMKESSKSHLRFLNIPKMRAGKTIKFIDKLNEEKIELLMKLCKADKRGREPSQDINEEKLRFHIDCAQQAINEWTGKRLKDNGYEGTGEAFGQTLLNRRAHQYKELINAFDN